MARSVLQPVPAGIPVLPAGPYPTRAAPRIDGRLLVLIARFDDPRRPIAETNRRLGAAAERLALTRPSYEQVRVHIHAYRIRGDVTGIGAVALAVAFRVRLPRPLVKILTGGGTPTHIPATGTARPRGP